MKNETSPQGHENSPVVAAKAPWDAPTVEELDYTSTETGNGAPGADGPYTS